MATLPVTDKKAAHALMVRHYCCKKYRYKVEGKEFSTGIIFSPFDCLALGVLFFQAHHHVPRIQDFCTEEHMPSAETVTKHFGSIPAYRDLLLSIVNSITDN
jgi:hypothetical protein